MTRKTLIAAAVAAAFAASPFTLQAAGDKASAGASKSDGGAAAMFKSLDKNKDGSISKDVMYDFLHPSAKGYEIWVSAMMPTLNRLLASP